MAFINVMCNMSVDCDCCAVAEDPKAADIGILSSLDPVALDQACLDLVYQADDPGKADLIERIEIPQRRAYGGGRRGAGRGRQGTSWFSLD